MTTVTGHRPSLRQRKKEATRAHILDVAIRMFAERGMDAPTVDEIAAAAEVGKGTIYNYFATKEEIVVAFMGQLEESLQAKAHKLARHKGSLAHILADFAWTHLKLKEPYRDFVRVVMVQVVLPSASLNPYLVDLQRVIDPPLLELFSNLQERGLLRRDVALADLVNIFKALQVGFTVVWLNDNPPYRGTRRMIETELRLFAEGTSPKGSHAKQTREAPRRETNGEEKV